MNPLKLQFENFCLIFLIYTHFPTVFPVPKLSDASEISLWIFERTNTALISTPWSYNFNLLRKSSFFFIFVENSHI